MPPTFRIAVLPGDGIGPDVIGEAVKVLRSVETQLGGVHFELEEFSVGAGEYLRSGDPLPPETFERCKQFDAILLGAMGLPGVRWPNGTVGRSASISGVCSSSTASSSATARRRSSSRGSSPACACSARSWRARADCPGGRSFSTTRAARSSRSPCHRRAPAGPRRSPFPPMGSPWPSPGSTP